MREREAREKTTVRITELLETALNLQHAAERIRKLAEESLEFGAELEVLSWKTFSDSLERCRTFAQHTQKAVDDLKAKVIVQNAIKKTSTPSESEAETIKAASKKYHQETKKADKKGG